jgi:hypothetical protein
MKLSSNLLEATLKATTVNAVEQLLAGLPINHDYVYDAANPKKGWREGQLHLVPVGLDPGNAGRIRLGAEPDNKIAERVVNMMEAVIELARREELKAAPGAAAPADPRAAVHRYFNLPRLDQIPELEGAGRSGQLYKLAKAFARKLQVRVHFSEAKRGVKSERSVVFSDEGIGQAPSRLHSTILSLGGDNKIKDRYLIGMWGQGGSSALAASKLTWIMSRRAPQLGDAEDDVAWTVVRAIHPTGLRRPCYAYLAAKPTGEVPFIPAAAANESGFQHGTRIGHVAFDFGNMDVTRLYQAMNHVLPNPVLPFDICTKREEAFDTCWGIGYLLTRAREQGKANLDKTFPTVKVERKEQG